MTTIFQHRQRKRKKTVKDLTGMVFGKLTVLRFSEVLETKSGAARFICLCECGKETTVRGSTLLAGQKSCGCSGGNRLAKYEASKNKLYHEYKQSAKARNLVLELTKSDVIDITSKDCYFCGKSPNRYVNTNNDNGHLKSNGIDRLDNSKGYTLDNCVPCCAICNRMKLTLSVEDFLSHIESIYLWQQKD